jgi:transposase
MLRLVFHQPLRQTEGLLGSLLDLMGVDLPVPDHTTISRRAARLTPTLRTVLPDGAVTLVIDNTGLKVYGAGEWHRDKHGMRGRRTWRKLHLAVDAATSAIVAATLTTSGEGDAGQVGPLLDQTEGSIDTVMADGAYDGEPTYQTVAGRDPAATVVIPPRSTSVPGSGAEPTQRDRHIQSLADKSRLGWQRETDYGKRSMAETAMSRYKRILGDHLHARKLFGQQAEAAIGVAVLNRMIDAGRPESVRVA